MANRFLNNITINDAYTFPTADGTAGQVMTTDGGGNITFETIADGESVKVACKNTSGSTITKGTPVYITGTVGSSYIIEIAGADASNISKMPAVGLLETDLANNGEGYVITGGVLKNLTTDPIDSSTPSSNDTIYVKSGGGLTLTKPSGTNYIQNIGKVGRVNSSNAGSIIVSSIMRTNDVPAPLFVDVANQKVGIGQSTPEVSLDISATDAVQMPSGTTAQRPTGEAGMFRYNSEEGQFEGYTTEWGAIAGGGGDTGTVTIEKNVYTGDGSDTTFDTTSTIADERNVQVYIDGIYQSKDNYTTSGSTVTFSTAPPNGVSVELIHIVAITGQTSLDKFTGDGSTTAFNLSQTIDSENNVQVYIDGVYQSKDNYSTSGNTLTFTTAPANNQAIEAVHIKAVDVSAMNSDQFTGDGSTTAFSLTNAPSSEDKTLVFVQGVYQEKSTYSISGTTLTFTTAPPNGYTVEVVVYSKITIADNTVNVERFTGDNSTVAFTLTNAPSAANNLDVYISGLYQEKNTYSFSGSTVTLDTAPVTGAVVECRSVANITGVTASSINDLRYSVDLISTNTNAVVGKLYVLTGNCTLTLPASPNTGDSIKISNRSGVATAVIARNGNKIMGDASDLTIDKLNAGFEMIYSGSAQGWVLIGIEGTAA